MLIGDFMKFVIFALLLGLGFAVLGITMEQYTDSNELFAVFGYCWGCLSCFVYSKLGGTY